jgi:hypothetical protein
VASKGEDGEFNFNRDAGRNRKQNRREQKRQDQKARKAGKAERAAGDAAARHGDGASPPAEPVTVRRVSDDGETG